MKQFQLFIGDCLATMRGLPPQSIQCCVTSPPYFGLRDYGVDGQIGLEETPEDYVSRLVEVFREVRRVLRDDGTLWLNLGDSYAGSGKGRNADGSHQEGGKQGTSRGTIEGKLVKTRAPDCKPKDLIGIPWRVAFALQADGWYLRQDIIWHKPNPMPESVTDRCTKAHEYVFLLSKSPRYYFDQASVKEPVAESSAASGQTRNRRSVWTVTTKPFKGAHFATFPPDLIEPCILAGAPKGAVILDPFGGTGTTAGVALKHGRRAVICELNPEYAALVERRVEKISGLALVQNMIGEDED